MPVGTPPAPRVARSPHRPRATRQRGLLRRRLHPHPSRTGLRRRGLSGLRRAPRSAGRRVPLRGGGARGLRGARTAAGRRLPAGAVSALRVARVLTRMGAVGGDGIEACSLQIYDEWALCHHFTLYDDVSPTLAALHAAGYRIGLISNTHRCLDSFQSHFALEPYITAAVSSFGPRLSEAAPEHLSRRSRSHRNIRGGRGPWWATAWSTTSRGPAEAGMAAVLLVRSGQAPENGGRRAGDPDARRAPGPARRRIRRDPPRGRLVEDEHAARFEIHDGANGRRTAPPCLEAGIAPSPHRRRQRPAMGVGWGHGPR